MLWLLLCRALPEQPGQATCVWLLQSPSGWGVKVHPGWAQRCLAWPVDARVEQVVEDTASGVVFPGALVLTQTDVGIDCRLFLGYCPGWQVA